MKQFTHRLEIQSRGKGLYEFTRDVAAWVKSCALETGLLTIFVQHTSASLVIQENADPDVRADLNEFFERVASEEADWYRHTIEGPDDMPAHIRAALTQTNLSVPVVSGKLALGTWQGIYLFEHRARPHRRTIVLHVIGA
jgi:secondary thiamine-phosphate synthase enzyme